MGDQVREICLIAPSERLAQKAETLIGELGAPVAVYRASLEDAAQCARQLMERGAEVFIFRTGPSVPCSISTPGTTPSAAWRTGSPASGVPSPTVWCWAWGAP